MHLINQAVAQPNPSLPQIAVRVDRQKLAKRLWRVVADDGTEIGCELERPLQPGDTVFQTEQVRYVVTQEPEAVLEIRLDLPPSAAAGVGWAIGNLHLELMSEPERLLALDEKAVRRLLDRIGVAYRETTAVFRPGRFARGENNQKAQIDELGPSHKH
ncbi:MAG: urease accessory protein UreE [Verrucomicrobia bacterium]|nr:urease accessory protein UreE [Verrucomicrobiota bacterium]